MGAIFTNIAEIFAKSGWAQIFFTEGGWKYAVMLAVACVLLYLAIVKQFEPLLLLPIGFGMLMTNLPLDGIFHMDIFINETNHIDWALLGSSGGMVDYIYSGRQAWHLSAADLPRHRHDDRLRAADRPPVQPAAGRCRTAGYLLHLCRR